MSMHQLPASIRQRQGFILATIIVFLLFMLFMVLGSIRLGIFTQKYSGNSSDLALAQNLANQAIFDSNAGALRTILDFEENSAWGGIDCEQLRPELMAADQRKICLAQYFANSCTNSLAPIKFQKGLCAPPVATSFSLPLLRSSSLDAAQYKPCATYTLTNVASGTATIPLIDINDNNGNAVFAFTYNSGFNNLCSQPRFQIELLNDDFQIATSVNSYYVSGARLYRVTSRAFGRNGNTQASRQAYFYLTCPNNSCHASLLNTSWW